MNVEDVLFENNFLLLIWPYLELLTFNKRASKAVVFRCSEAPSSQASTDIVI